MVTNSTAAAILTIGNDNTSPTFAGIITASTQNTLALAKVGAGVQTLTGASTYAGVTTVSAGTLALGNIGSSSTSTLGNTTITVSAVLGASLAPVVVSGAPSNIVNVGSASGGAASVTLSTAAGASATLDMRDSTIGIFTINQAVAATGLTIGGATAGQTAASLKFDIGTVAGSIDLLQTTGKAVVGNGTTGGTGGLITINALGSSLASGSYTFIMGATGSNLGNANLALANPSLSAGGHTYSGSLATSTATAEILTISQTSTLANAYWDGLQGTSWNTYLAAATSFSSSAASVVDPGVLPAFNTNVKFTITNPPGAGNLATTLGENFTINSLNFLGTSTSAVNAVSVSGNVLTIQATNANGNTAGSGITVAPGNGAVIINSAVVLAASQSFTNNSSNTLTVNGNISGAANLTTFGSGTTNLAGANSYSGSTTVSGGATVVSGSISGTTSVTVGNGTNPATLAGAGTITTVTTGSVNVASAATLAPGLSANGMSINAPVSGTSTLNLNAGSTLQLTIANSQSGTSGAPLAADYSKLSLGSGVSATLGGTLVTNESLAMPINRGDLFTIILTGTSISTRFTNATGTPIFGSTYLYTSTSPGNQQYEINYHYDGTLNAPGLPTGVGVDATAFANITGGTNVAILAIPEPKLLRHAGRQPRHGPWPPALPPPLLKGVDGGWWMGGWWMARPGSACASHVGLGAPAETSDSG